jgi:hypothetical protein
MAADSIFTDRLRMLPNLALVPHSEAAVAEKAARQSLGLQLTPDGPGYSMDDIRKLIATKADMPPDLLAAVQRFEQKTSSTVVNPTLTTKRWMDAKNAALTEASRGLAEVRYRVQGLRPLRERMLLNFKDSHLKRQLPTVLSRWQQNKLSPLNWLQRGFTADALARLPDPVRLAWKKLKSQWERNADELGQEIRRDGGQKVLDRIVERYRPAVPDELAIADEVLRPIDDNASLVDRTAQVLSQWKHKPEWLEKMADDPIEEITVELRRWAKETAERGADGGREWLKAAAATIKRSDDVVRAIDELPTERARAVYDELVRGNTQGPNTLGELARLGMPKFDGQEALVHYALQLREKALLSDAVREALGDKRVVLSSDERMPVLAAVLAGEYKTTQNGRTVYRHGDAETTWALQTLRDWGIEPGSGASLQSKRIGGKDVMLPDFLVDELNSMQRAGALDGKELTPARAYNELMRVYKESLTHGFIAPNPAYLLGQVLGMLPTLVSTRGLAGAGATVATTFWRHPRMVGELVKRVGGVNIPRARTRTPDDELLRAGQDGLFHVDELEQAIRQQGLHESRAAFETEENLRQLINRSESKGVFQRMGKSLAFWQETLRNFAGSVDLTYRIATFVDEVAKGTPLDLAAETAKSATLDFRAMTPFEQKVMRNALTFYAFTKANSAAQIGALVRHPERVMLQMRAAHASLTEGLGLSGVEQGGMEQGDLGRYTLWRDNEVADDEGRIKPQYRMNRVTTPPIGIADWLWFVTQLSPTSGPQGVFGSDNQDLARQFVPLANLFAIQLQGRALGQTFQTAQSNFVPPVLLDGFWGGYVMDLFGVGPEPLEPTDDPGLYQKDASDMLGTPSKWAAGGKHVLEGKLELAQRDRERWQSFMALFAKPVLQAETAAEAMGYERPPPYMTQWDSTRDLLFGTKTRPVLSEDELLRRKDEELVKTLNRFASPQSGIGLPEGIGPR